TQLTQGERYHIQYLSRHCTVTEIAKQLNRHKSTISREIRRHRTQGQQYSAEKAQRQSQTIKQRKRQPYKLDSQLIQHIDPLIRRKLSPEQVCAYLCKHHQITLHHSTIYRYLRQDKSNGSTLWQHLRICSKPYRKRYGSTWTRGKVPNRVGIENRPAIVDQKSRIGDWEADTIVGKGQKSALLTLVERVTRYTIICKLDSLKAEDTARAAVRALKAHKDRVHTITMDNGKEFYQHTKITKALKAETYFCRPYHSWEKGLNENTNGLIRQYFPKQTDFRNISDREIRRVQDELNHRPRKTLGYETPSVLFLNLFQPL
ncbi:IS30-like element IS1655 family transposase, partial [Neisseria meningitidis]|nr:IS30-like element IS1655 family transposase [Neisseria meningitidis]MBG9192123.1 IS30-like element IS1655 family transposase [Neisseria meningitidis]MBG9208968.1 IS30-like element IS1655 family transposase [Neisseria meningitidis]